MARRFVVLGSIASASDDFLIDDVPGTSGRLDVLVRCIRAALLHSHGVRRDAFVYLVLGGGPKAPRTLRFDGANAKFLRPDERALAVLVKKCLATDADEGVNGFVDIKPGIAIARGGLHAALGDCKGTLYLLDERGDDIRDRDLDRDATFVLGDHLGISPEDAGELVEQGASLVSVGPTSLHTDDVIAIVGNEIDRARRTTKDR